MIMMTTGRDEDSDVDAGNNMTYSPDYYADKIDHADILYNITYWLNVIPLSHTLFPVYLLYQIKAIGKKKNT